MTSWTNCNLRSLCDVFQLFVGVEQRLVVGVTRRSHDDVVSRHSQRHGDKLRHGLDDLVRTMDLQRGMAGVTRLLFERDDDGLLVLLQSYSFALELDMRPVRTFMLKFGWMIPPRCSESIAVRYVPWIFTSSR